MTTNWLYSDDRLKLREQCLSILLKKYGCKTIPIHDNESIYACAHDWVSQGHPTTNGILTYYQKYYD